MGFERAAGVLLHPTSLPGFGGIGSLGTDARNFLDLLSASGIRLWQVLPLGPTGYGDSPYSALSAFAGNPLLISLEPLVEYGFLNRTDLEPLTNLPAIHADFGRVIPLKMAALRRSFENARGDSDVASQLQTFQASNSSWLSEYSLFMALKDSHGGSPWYEWRSPLRARDPDALQRAREDLPIDLDFHVYLQYLFRNQWQSLRSYGEGLGIKIIGDIPIFVAHDSVDVWSNQHLFKLDTEGNPEVVAGVPPDYFSPTGQLWGNPHYRWDVIEAEGFSWWIERFRTLLQMVDIVRLDHFRGFAASWSVPHGDLTAEHGEWVPAPGAKLFEALQRSLKDVPIIAEDLGVITPDVEKLRVDFGFPGMHILQFAFGTGATDPGLPHNYVSHSVVYTGTHDNDTSIGWFSQASETERSFAVRYAGSRGYDIAWDLLRMALSSVAVFAIVPLQDIFRLGSVTRMNYPGRAHGNWSWRFLPGDFTEEHVRNLKELTTLYGRDGETK